MYFSPQLSNLLLLVLWALLVCLVRLLQAGLSVHEMTAGCAGLNLSCSPTWQQLSVVCGYHFSLHSVISQALTAAPALPCRWTAHGEEERMHPLAMRQRVPRKAHPSMTENYKIPLLLLFRQAPGSNITLLSWLHSYILVCWLSPDRDLLTLVLKHTSIGTDGINQRNAPSQHRPLSNSMHTVTKATAD